ncbi:hypothetical protein AC249_AIPGENE9682 [Exaiptasia diaphana]|nr:hypothetical protein AC249_AIPGENE9682 [Exaiptasia diaphana]
MKTSGSAVLFLLVLAALGSFDSIVLGEETSRSLNCRFGCMPPGKRDNILKEKLNLLRTKYAKRKPIYNMGEYDQH